jgi:hypothetical protein
MCGGRRVALGAVLAVLLIGATRDAAATSPDPSDRLGCDAEVFDPGGLLDETVLAEPISSAAGALGADVHVRAERVVDGGLDDRMDQLLRRCPGWQVAGDLTPRLLVVMFSADEREASVFYGADLGPRLEDRWEPAIDAMTARFRDGDFSGGVRAGLRTLRTAPARPTSDFDPSDVTGRNELTSPATGGGTPAPTAGIIVFFLLVAVGSLIARYVFGWEGGGSGGRRSSFDQPGHSAGGSFRPFSGGGHRSGGGSSPSSSGGSRSSGGGTKKW